MRKATVFLFAVLFVLGGVVSAFAVTADTTHKGSLLIYPKINVTDNVDTFIWLSNDGPSAVDIKCYWVNGVNYGTTGYGAAQDFTDFSFSLSKYQEFNFSGKNGGITLTAQAPGFTGADKQGFLACLAVIDNGTGPVGAASWNYLYGKAWVVDYNNNVAYSYPAWSFRAQSVPTGAAPTLIPLAPGVPISGSTDAGLNLPLDGVIYNSCPAQLAFDFPLEFYPPKGFPFKGLNDLTVMPCKQDLRQDHAITITKFQFDVWNTFETKFTNAWACSNCWWDHFLNDPSSALHYFGPKGAFSAVNSLSIINGLEIPELTSFAGGRFRVTAVQSSQCPGSVPAGVIGVLASYLPNPETEYSDSIYSHVPPFAFSSNGVTGSADGPAGFILFDPSGSSNMPGVKSKK